MYEFLNLNEKQGVIFEQNPHKIRFANGKKLNVSKKGVFFGDKFVTEGVKNKAPQKGLCYEDNFAVCLSPLCHFPCVKSHAIRK